ncbi:DUF302 domain-containing protein [Streptomyces gobiensis]|uniref:DUF302 domain-containing protein n=1 Tax=Streptomyces gobiensis TaxID=2875706 RepID=UPI001E42D5B6|nr:DUF302 domain-containing protein [Streptomyces gobiensis]UGY94616.1 DUF302 domain-containing protein [Streptomyces gobiensis]
MTLTRPTTARLAMGVAALALTATACGSNDPAGSEPSPTKDAGRQTGSPAEGTKSVFSSYASDKSFAEVEKGLKKAAADADMMVLGDLNQAGALKSTGLRLKGARAYFIGNPTKGKMFFQQNAAIGAEIPLRMYVWADDDGKGHVGYFDPAAMFEAIEPKLAEGGEQMAADKIAQGATGASAEEGAKATAGYQIVDSEKSFADVEKALKKAAADADMMVLGDLNQAGALKSTGLRLKGARAYFIGNPTKGKMFFQQNPAIGAVIPLRMYVWADDDGSAHVGYFDPAPLFEAIDPKLAEGGEQMKMAAEKIANGAAK